MGKEFKAFEFKLMTLSEVSLPISSGMVFNWLEANDNILKLTQLPIDSGSVVNRLQSPINI